MSYEIVRREERAVARRHDTEIATIERKTELVAHKMRAVALTGEFAISRAVMLQLAQKAAEEIAPNGAEAYAAIAQTATLQMIGLISDLGYQLR